jgi:lipoate---protein ligase
VKWRFIPFKRYDPYVKIALNEIAINSVRKDNRGIIWFAGWKPSCVNIGYGQNIREVVNLDEIKKRNLMLVRRQGGGGAMYLDEKGEITWNIIAPEEFFPKDPNKIYEKVCGKVVDALREMSIKAKHKPINDVMTEKGKISGVTLKKDDGVVYIAGTLLYEVNKKILEKILRPEKDMGKRKSFPEKEKKVTAVCKESGASFEETLELLKNNFLKNTRYEEEYWSEEELLNAEKLAKKYKSEEWIYQK